MKKITGFAILTALYMFTLIGCTPSLAGRDAYSKDDKTGAEDLMDLIAGVEGGDFSVPITNFGATGFSGSENSVVGDTYTDGLGTEFHVADGKIEAPIDSSTGNYISPLVYNEKWDCDQVDGNQLVWFQINNKNFGKSGTDVLDYTFPITYSGTFIVTGTGFNFANHDNEDSEDLFNPVNCNSSYEGQFVGITVGFVDVNLEKKAGIIVRAFDAGSTDYVILQVPDLSQGGELMNVPYVGGGNFITQGTPFELTLALEGGSSGHGATVRIYVDGNELFPQGASSAFGNDLYQDYVNSAFVLSILEVSRDSWDMLWNGANIIGKDVGSIAPIVERAVFIVNLGANVAGTNAYKKSPQLVKVSNETDWPDE
ncbi:MAG: hypothetical protein GY754_25440 [bacterium]|nr:hypothetical protein [bacterium]